jgi:hypothetical protein
MISVEDLVGGGMSATRTTPDAQRSSRGDFETHSLLFPKWLF